MKTILYTGWDASYKPLADLTVPLMHAWAAKHKMDSVGYTEPPDGLNIYWTGVARGLELLRRGYDRVMYLDVDQMITNPDYDLKARMVNFEHGFHVPMDWGSDATGEWDISACCLVMHQDCLRTLHEILALEPSYRDMPFPEQAPMRHVLKQFSLTFGTPPSYKHNRKPWNCVPDQVCPGSVPEPWQPGDFAAHLTMVPLERRIEIFHELKGTKCS